MSWEVTAKVSGGCKYSTEETEAYMRAAKALSHQADALSRAHDSVRALSLQLSSYPYASSAIASLSGSSPYCNATDHIELPYDQLVEQCDAHASALGAMAARLSELSALIIRAQSLYSQVDDAGRRTLNELLQVAITSFPKESILAGAAMSALGYVMGSTNEGKSNPIYLLDSLDWAQEGIMSAAGAAVSGYGKVKGLLRTDEVNHATISPSPKSIRKPKWCVNRIMSERPWRIFDVLPRNVSARPISTADLTTAPSPSPNTVNPTEPTHGSSPFQAQTASTILHLGGRKTSNS